MVTGTLSLGVLSSDDVLDIDAGGTISAASGEAEYGTVNVEGTLAALLVSGGLTVGSGGLDISNGGLLQAGSLSLSDGYLDVTGGATVQLGSLSFSGGNLEVDGTSSVEIGTAGDAASGAIIVDAGQSVAASGALGGNLIDDGLITTGTGDGDLLRAARWS